ncbi:MAG: zinc ribbon domain-containing protein [Candidatus Heimdallarchaeota archaeon]|nr:zinc ribbon domain-containing protein [Candidatus Heimdallarchaeota archaeon]
MVFWIIAATIDIIDMISSFIYSEILAGIMDLLVVIALVCYVFTPLIASAFNKENPVQLTKILFVVFAGTTIFFDFLYLVITLITGYFPTYLYWITVVCDILLITFTILGVLTTLKDEQSLTEYLYPETAKTQLKSKNLEKNIDSEIEISGDNEDLQKRNTKLCSHCGATIKQTSAFCPKCGKST